VSEIYRSSIVLPTDLAQLGLLEQQVDDLLAYAPAVEEPEIARYNIWLATHELCVNIIGHAYDGDPGEFAVTFSLKADPLRVEVDTHDHGRALFDLQAWAPPDLDDPPIHGLGIFLMHELMDEVEYAPRIGDSRWHLTKYLQPAAANSPALASTNGSLLQDE
jgi:serine/threonine-protein kinase RsbW